MGEEFRLCNACKGFNFSPYGELSESPHELGTPADLSKRRKYCVFCHFLYTGFLSGPSTVVEQGAQYVAKIDLRRDIMGWVPSNENGKSKDTKVHMVSVGVSKSSGVRICLTPCLIPVPSVRDYCSSPSIYLKYEARSFTSRLIEPKVSIQLPRKWLDLCRKIHGNICESPSWLHPYEYPVNMRLIDVRKLCVMKAQPEWSYICLSYVWGTSSLRQETQARRETIHDLERPFGLERIELPRTILDAIRFVQDMGEHYLWVDCLCIVQDDESEMRIQINQMDLIYARALLTVAVVAGDDCNSGIPHLYREIRKPRQQHVQISRDLGLMISEHDGWYKEEEKWATRGWTYQELHLSRRVLMVFKEMLHWRCECDYWNEKTCLEPSQTISKSCTSKLPLSLGISFFQPRFDLRMLDIHVTCYNDSLEFTDEGDALDAFKGILKRIEAVSETGFHWALPRRYFHHSLLWRNHLLSGWRQNRPRKALCKMMSRNGDIYTARLPSWSWIGWYTALHGRIYDAQEAQRRFGESSLYDTDWAAEWFRVDTVGKLSELEQSHWHDHQRFRMLERSRRPLWAGNSLEPDRIGTTSESNDTGCIVALTSYAQCKIRAQFFDDITRRRGGEPKDGFKYDLLDGGGKIIALLHSIDLVRPSEEYDEARIAEEKITGATTELYRDLETKRVVPLC